MKKGVLVAAILILIATIILECLIFLHIVRLPFIQITFMGLTHSPTHWVGWIGTIYIAITAPILPLVIKKAPKLTGKVLNMHILGNVIAILFISVHFAHQVTRSLSRYPDLGTGIVLYVSMISLVATGLMLFSGKGYPKACRFFHPAFVLVFYLVIIMHIVHGI